MPEDLVKRLNLDLLYPPFLERLLETLAACRARGADFYAISGYRSPSEQMALWAQGRTKPGPIITNAKGGESVHQSGAAVDCCLDADTTKAGLQVLWSSPKYQILKAEGEKRGLGVGVPKVPGGDPGHVQLPLSKKRGVKESVLLKELKAEFDKGGLPAVFKKLDDWGPW